MPVFDELVAALVAPVEEAPPVLVEPGPDDVDGPEDELLPTALEPWVVELLEVAAEESTWFEPTWPAGGTPFGTLLDK
jgi:hypothetical protein